MQINYYFIVMRMKQLRIISMISRSIVFNAMKPTSRPIIYKLELSKLSQYGWQ